MKFQIQTEKDLQHLQGKFVLEINSDEPDKTLIEFGWGFVKEKRLYLIAGYKFITLYGDIRDSKDFEHFKMRFNSYIFDHSTVGAAEGILDGKRFYRLLTSKELDYLCTKMKEENY